MWTSMKNNLRKEKRVPRPSVQITKEAFHKITKTKKPRKVIEKEVEKFVGLSATTVDGYKFIGIGPVFYSPGFGIIFTISYEQMGVKTYINIKYSY